MYFFQDILNDKDCEELDPDSGSIHTGNPIMFPETTGTGKKSQPPTSLNLDPVIGMQYAGTFLFVCLFVWGRLS